MLSVKYLMYNIKLQYIIIYMSTATINSHNAPLFYYYYTFDIFFVCYCLSLLLIYNFICRVITVHLDMNHPLWVAKQCAYIGSRVNALMNIVTLGIWN